MKTAIRITEPAITSIRRIRRRKIATTSFSEKPCSSIVAPFRSRSERDRVERPVEAEDHSIVFLLAVGRHVVLRLLVPVGGAGLEREVLRELPLPPQLAPPGRDVDGVADLVASADLARHADRIRREEQPTGRRRRP